MPKKSEIRLKDIVTASLMLVGDVAVVASLYFTFIAKGSGKEARLLAEISKKKTEVQELAEAKKTEAAMQTTWQRSSELMAPLWKRMAEAEETPEESIHILYEVAKDNQITIRSAQHQNEAVLNSNFDEISYRMTAVGNYHDLGRFLHALEAGARFVRVNALGLTMQRDGKVMATFELHIYPLRRSAGEPT